MQKIAIKGARFAPKDLTCKVFPKSDIVCTIRYPRRKVAIFIQLYPLMLPPVSEFITGALRYESISVIDKTPTSQYSLEDVFDSVSESTHLPLTSRANSYVGIPLDVKSEKKSVSHLAPTPIYNSNDNSSLRENAPIQYHMPMNAPLAPLAPPPFPYQNAPTAHNQQVIMHSNQAGFHPIHNYSTVVNGVYRDHQGIYCCNMVQVVPPPMYFMPNNQLNSAQQHSDYHKNQVPLTGLGAPYQFSSPFPVKQGLQMQSNYLNFKLQKDGTTIPKNKKKKTFTRTRTGCLTCKRRRVKCDEAKPSCYCCQKSNRKCDGYAENVLKNKRRNSPTRTMNIQALC